MSENVQLKTDARVKWPSGTSGGWRGDRIGLRNRGGGRRSPVSIKWWEDCVYSGLSLVFGDWWGLLRLLSIWQQNGGI